MKTIFSIFELPYSISLDVSALGGAYDIEISKVKGKLYTPHLPAWEKNQEDPLGKLLLAPELADSWSRGSDQIFWGKPHRYPSGESSVHSILLAFECNSLDEDGSAVHKGFISWINLLLDYIEISTNQNVRVDQSLNVYGDNFHLFYFDENGKSSGISDEKVIEICLDSWQKSIDAKSFQKACELASLGFQPKLCYKLFLEANRAYLQKDYRKTVIECGAAVETALTDAIVKKLQLLDTSESDIDRRLRGNKTLGGRFHLADSQLGLDVLQIQYDYRSILVEPRNQAIHDAEFVTRQVARQAIEYTKKLLVTLVPDMPET
ncbi:hypothetical protein L4D08_25985 [Photobacterium chitinilyticum]|uniref:hypothetical protein n=1 Tax=Photobacterium chitinilyticum TaxID=2485123 RepID=UPI003D0974A6